MALEPARLLYVILLGHCPFHGSGMELQDAIQRVDFAFDAPLSSHAQSLMKALLKRDPKRRATLDWCLIHPFVSPALGHLLLHDGLAESEVKTDEMLEESYMLPSMPEMAMRCLASLLVSLPPRSFAARLVQVDVPLQHFFRQTCLPRLKFRYSAMTQGTEALIHLKSVVA